MSYVVTCDWCGQPIARGDGDGPRQSYMSLQADGHSGRWTSGSMGQYHDDNVDDTGESCFGKLNNVLKLASSWAPTLEAIPTASAQNIARLRQAHRGEERTPDAATADLVREDVLSLRREIEDVRRRVEERRSDASTRPWPDPKWTGKRKMEWAVMKDAPRGGILKLGLPSAVVSALRRANVLTTDALRGMTDQELLAIDGIGPVRLGEIRDALKLNATGVA
jgi:hypothetical protein